jgi:hypothetical protein
MPRRNRRRRRRESRTQIAVNLRPELPGIPEPELHLGPSIGRGEPDDRLEPGGPHGAKDARGHDPVQPQSLALADVGSKPGLNGADPRRPEENG